MANPVWFEISNLVPSQSSIHGRTVEHTTIECQVRLPLTDEIASVQYGAKSIFNSRTNSRTTECQVSLQFTDEIASRIGKVSHFFLQIRTLALSKWPLTWNNLSSMHVDHSSICKTTACVEEKKNQVWMIIGFCFPIWIPVLYFSNLPSHSNSAKCIKG